MDKEQPSFLQSPPDPVGRETLRFLFWRGLFIEDEAPSSLPLLSVFPMPNAGRFVTNAEVAGFASTVDPGVVDGDGVIGLNPQIVLIIKAAEEVLLHELERGVLRQDYVDERYLVKQSTSWDGFIQIPNTGFPLRNYPVTEWTLLKIVTGWDKTTGDPITTTIGRDMYTVDTDIGQVRFYQSSYPHSYLGGSLGPLGVPGGGDLEFLCTYQAGYSQETIPSDLRLFVLEYISRISRMMADGRWGLSQIRSEYGADVILRVGLTMEEKSLLAPFKRPVLV